MTQSFEHPPVERPVVFIGTDEVLSFFNTNTQSTRRTKHRYEIKPFSFPTDTEGDLYALVDTLLNKSEEMLGVNTATISSRLVLSQQLYLATSGVIDYIRTFIDKSVLEALETDKNLTIDIFSEIFNQIETSLCLTNSNPFDMSEQDISAFIKSKR